MECGRYHSINVSDCIGVRSLISHAAGNAVDRVKRPRVLKVQAGPIWCIMTSITRLITVPPRPPPAQTRPLARPRFR